MDGFSGATALGDLASFMSDKATVAGEVVQSNVAVQSFSMNIPLLNHLWE